jgi:hypothetical protein
VRPALALSFISSLALAQPVSNGKFNNLTIQNTEKVAVLDAGVGLFNGTLQCLANIEMAYDKKVQFGGNVYYSCGAALCYTNNDFGCAGSGTCALGTAGHEFGQARFTTASVTGAYSCTNGSGNNCFSLTVEGARIATGPDTYIKESGTDVVMSMGTGSGTPALEATAVSNTVAVGNLGASGPDDLQTYTLPASSLVSTGRCVRATATGTTTNNANAKTVRLVFGAGPTALVTKQLTASVAGSWQLTGTICRTGASTQRYWGTGENSGGTTVSTTDGTGVWRIPTVTGTATETETNTMVIKTQSTASTTDNDIVSQVLQVEFF